MRLKDYLRFDEINPSMGWFMSLERCGIVTIEYLEQAQVNSISGGGKDYNLVGRSGQVR